MKLYLLRTKNEKHYLTCYAQSNQDEEFGNDTSVNLEIAITKYEPLWCTTDLIHAWIVKNQSSSWYSSNFSFPINGFKPNELEIVCVESNQADKIVDIETEGFNDFLFEKAKEDYKENKVDAEFLNYTFNNFKNSKECKEGKFFLDYNGKSKEFYILWAKQHTKIEEAK